MTKSQTETSDEFNRRWLNVRKFLTFILINVSRGLFLEN
jgi:hypothetical protein